MCGIVGRVNFDGILVDPIEIQRMTDAIAHRGPDDQGQHVVGGVGLGMRRLSIIDLAGGHQPMQTSDGELTVVFNGEIYNYREVRTGLEAKGYRFRTASDTESILHAYREYGVDCLQHLNGMFAIALWDQKRRQLLLARDRLGIKPLYVVEDGRQIRFASEIKALLTDRTLSRDLDLAALGYFLRYGYVAAPGTLLRSVRKLPPAHYLLFGERGTTTRRYWAPHYAEVEHSLEEHAEAVCDGLAQAVRRQLVSDVPLGAFLSGGLDSSSILALMSSSGAAPVNTYSIGFGKADAFHNELSDARSVANHYAANHHEIVVDRQAAELIPRLVHHLDEPLADSSFVVTYLVSTLAVQTVKVILSGVGGDELFGGYRRYLGPRLAPWYQSLPTPVRRGTEKLTSVLRVDRGSMVRNYARLARSFVAAQAKPAYEQYDAAVRVMTDAAINRLSPAVPESSQLELARRDTFESVQVSDPVSRLMHLDLETSLAESLLLLTDKMTMAASIEARVPFLDHEFVELTSRIPARHKVSGTRLRHVQKRAMRGKLPNQVLAKKKRGFGFPIGAWFRRDLRELLEDVLSPSQLARDRVLDDALVRELIDEHVSMRADHSDALLALLTFSIWRDQVR